MAVGKTIIGMIDGSAQEVIRKSKCGICVWSSDIDSLAEAMNSFIRNRNDYKDCSQNGRDYVVKHFRKDIFMRILEKKIKEMEQYSNVTF